MSSLRSPAALAAVLAVAVLGPACGDEDEPVPSQPAAQAQAKADDDGDGVPNGRDPAPQDAGRGAREVVSGDLDLPDAPAGSADAGTQAGHDAGSASAATAKASFTLSGRVRPATSTVTLRNRDTDRSTQAEVAADGRFEARLRGLRRGVNSFVLRGEAPGHAPWTLELAVTRR